MTALYRLMSVWLLLPTLLLAGCGSDTTESVNGLTLSSSNSSLDVTQPDRFVTITATVRDADNNLLPNANVRFDTNLGSFSATGNVTSDTKETGRGGSQDAGNGVAAIKLYSGQTSGTATVTAFVNGFQQSVTITINGPSSGGSTDTTTQAATIALVVSNATLDTSAPDRFVSLDATVRDKNNNLLSNAKVEFTTSLGSFSSAGSVLTLTQATSSGIASLKLYPGTVAGTTLVKAYINGIESTVSLRIQGPTTAPKAAAINLTKSSESLDTGFQDRFVNLSATILDESNNPYPNADVEFSSSLGSFSTTGAMAVIVAKTNDLGIATVKLYPGKSPGTATITAFIDGLQDTEQVVIQGADLELPYPASVSIAASAPSLFVTGVDEADSTTITIQLLTPAGLLARDAPTGVNNVRVSLLSKPNGGEHLKGQNASGVEVQDSSAIEVATKNGSVAVTLKAGTLPGLLQLKAEALNDAGQSYNPVIQSQNLNLNISSGPAHTLITTFPENSMTNLNNGIYRKMGALIVTDRYGNAVSDGTLVNLGILDSVISSNLQTNPDSSVNPSTTADSSVLTDPVSGVFTSASITRNNLQRFIEPSDRVLIFNTKDADRSRFVSVTPTQDNQLNVNKDYLNTTQNLQYLVGASLLGTQVSGVVAGEANPVSGRATTTAGAATFYITFPANSQTILTGCIDEEVDTRHPPQGSAQLWLVAEAAEGTAVTLDNQSCMNAISPIVLINNSGLSTIGGSSTIQLYVEDAGEVGLPFVTIQSSVSYAVNTGGLTVALGNCGTRADNRTNSSGICNLPITVTGGVAGDRAQITLSALNSAAVQITVQL